MRKNITAFLFMALSLIFISCSEPEEEEPLESITAFSFDDEYIKIGKGSSCAVNLTLEPSSRIGNSNVTYELSEPDKDFISLSNTSSTGLVVTAKKSGSTVIIAKCEGWTSYLEVDVFSDIFSDSPFISIKDPAYELKVGERRTFTVNLEGGNEEDKALFEWKSEDPSVCEITSADNACVMTAKKEGFTYIEVKHTKSEYPARVMVFVSKEKENPVYITTQSPVVILPLNGGTENIRVGLANSEINNLSLFSYDCTSGGDNLDYIANNNIISLTPKKEGRSVIKVSHSEAKVSLEMVVYVVDSSCPLYIDSQCFYDLSIGESVRCELSMEGTDGKKVTNPSYTFTTDKDGIVQCSVTGNNLFIKALKEGRVVVSVHSPYAENPHDIIVTVGEKDTELYYISCTDSVINLEEDGSDYKLDLSLAGGNEADKNSFTWTVEDSSVIEVNTTFGQVNYSRSASVYNGNEFLDVNCYITPKQVGRTSIKVEHPKSSVESNVLVNVYPKGTLSTLVPKVKGPSLIKVLKGSDYKLELDVVEGRSDSFVWESDTSSYIELNANANICNIYGKASGISNIIVKSGDNRIYSAVVACGTQDELDSMQILYAEQTVFNVKKGNKVYTSIKGINDSDTISVAVQDNAVCNAKMASNVLCIEALKGGETGIIVSSTECSNRVLVIVKVTENVSIDKPYYFDYEHFVGAVIGEDTFYSVSLSGGDQSVRDSIVWSIEDEEIADVRGSGNSCIINAKEAGKTVIYATCPKCENDARIVLYTARTREELEAMCVLDTEKYSYLCEKGSDILINVSVTDREKNMQYIQWESSDISVISVDGGNENAVIHCKDEGNAVLTVSCKSATPLKIFFSVVKDLNGNTVFMSAPNCIEMDEGESNYINLSISGFSDSEIRNIKWNNSDDEYVQIKGNGDRCYIKAIEKGFSDVTSVSNEKGLDARTSIVVYKAGEPHLPVLCYSSSYIKMSEGEIKDIELTYGSVKPTDEMVSSIAWEVEGSCIEISSNGNKCSLKALNEGISTIKAKSSSFVNEIEIKVMVGNKQEIASFYGENIIKIIKGQSKDYTVQISNMASMQTDYDLLEVENEGTDGLFEIERVGNVLHITALECGKAYLNISHPNVTKTFRLMLYSANTQQELDNAFLMNPRKTNYLIGIGEEAELTMDYSGTAQQLSKVKWSVNNASVCRYDVITKDRMKVRGKAEGKAVFTATYPETNESVTFNVWVTSVNYVSRISMVTPSVVVMEKNRVIPADEENGIPEYDLKKSINIATSLNSEECEKLVWKSLDESIVKVNGSGTFCMLEGISEGVAEVEVSYDKVNTRTIVVKVCENESDIVNTCLSNVDERYRVCSKGEIINIIPYSAIKICNFDNYIFEDLYKNNVISFEKKDDKLCVKCIDEGIGAIKIKNSQALNEYVLYFEVRENTGSISENRATGSLTSLQNIYTLNVNKKTEGVNINVSPVGIDENNWNSIEWICDDDTICSLAADKNNCKVYPLNEGICTVTCSSVYSQNVQRFKIIVGNEDSIKYPVIKTDKNTMRLKAGEYGIFTFNVENLANQDVSLYSYKVSDQSIISLSPNGNEVTVRGLKQGQCILTASYEGLDDVRCVVSVEGISENIVYLTTAESFTSIQKGYSKNVSVTLVGYDELASTNFKWEYKDTQSASFVTLTPNGSSAIIKGLKEGTATVVCTHTNSDPLKTAICPVEITIFVTDDPDYLPVYMKTPGVVSITEGTRQSVSMELVNGNESEYGYFSWNVYPDCRDIIKITPSGKDCLITALNPGIGRIQVSHPSCIGLSSVDLIVVVNEDTEKENLTITTDSTIIEGKLSDSYKTVSVNLNGGTSEQQLLFSWEIVSYESNVRNPDGTSLPVISLVSQSGNQNIVKYLREGVAVVRVRNSATSGYLDIKFVINEYSTLKFENPSVTLKEYESVTVGIESPSSKTVVYNSSDESIACVYGTGKVCIIEGVKNGYAVITARTSDGTLSDQISVRVNKNTEAVPVYITGSNLVSMDTTDKSGRVIKAVLNGTIDGEVIPSSENEFLQWKIKSGNTEVVKFAGTNSIQASGKEVTIIPTGPGEVEIEVSHTKAKKTKTVYVTVSSASASLILEEAYGIFEVGDIGSISAHISGVPVSEENEIVWSTADTEKLSFSDSEGEKTSVKGPSCVFRCKALCEEGVIITVSYKDVTKTYTAFIKALPSLHIMTSNDLVRTNQTKYYNIICTPEENISELSCSYSGSLYIKTSESGVMMTGLVKTESERIAANDNPPQGIRVPYMKVTGGLKEGTTSFNFECKSLSAVLNVKTDNTVFFNITGYDEFKSGKKVSHADNPGVIEVRADSDYTRVYYTVEPEVEIEQFKNSQYTAQLKNSFRSGTVKMVNGKNSGEGRYFDLYPDSEGCNWGDVYLYVNSQNIGIIRVSFSMPDSAKAFTLYYQDKTPNIRFTYDIANAFVKGAGKGENEYEGAKAQMTLKYTKPYYYATYDIGTGTYFKVNSNTNLFEDAPSFFNSENIPGTILSEIKRVNQPVLVSFEWPEGYGLTGSYSKYYVFYEEIWK